MSEQHLPARLCVPLSLHKERADKVLAALLQNYSRQQLARMLKAGNITRNGNPCTPKEKVLCNDSMEIAADCSPFSPASLALEPEDLPLQILYEDEALLVVNKPQGIVVHPGAGNLQHTLVNALLHHAKETAALPRAGIIHRLDKDTTGLLVVAKTLHAYTHLTRQMQAREIERKYLALVQGEVISGGRIETYYGRHPKNRLKMAVRPTGREAITEYSILQSYPAYTLLSVKLFTGRTHQIRVHMAHLQHSVLGDPLYGKKPRFLKNMPPALLQLLAAYKTQALHAAQLAFLHPLQKERLHLEAPLPDNFQHLIERLQHFASLENL